jgi:hypothetical protein
VSVYIPAALRTDHLTCGHDFSSCKTTETTLTSRQFHVMSHPVTPRHSSFTTTTTTTPRHKNDNGDNDNDDATSQDNDNGNDDNDNELRRDGGEGGYGQGPNARRLGQVCFFFLSFFIFY